MACNHFPSNPTSTPAFCPRRLGSLEDQDIPTGRWVILVDVAGNLHVTHVWDYQPDPDFPVILFSTKSGRYDEDEDADCRNFLVEAHDAKDTAHLRAQLLGNAYVLCRHVYHSRYSQEAPELVLQEWTRMYATVWQP